MKTARSELMKQIVQDSNLTTAGDIQTFLRDLFKDALQEMLEAELDVTLGKFLSEC